MKWCSSAVPRPRRRASATRWPTRSRCSTGPAWTSGASSNRQLDRALDLFEELGDLTGQASVLNILGGLAYFRGGWSRALDLYRRAQAMVRRTGNSVMDAFYMNNIGEIALEQGRLDEAAELFTEALRIWRAAGYRSGAASVKCRSAGWRVARGDMGTLCVVRGVPARSPRGWAGTWRCSRPRPAWRSACCWPGASERRWHAADSARAVACPGRGPAQHPLLFRVRGAALLRRGDGRGPVDALEAEPRAAAAREADYEQALTLRVLGRLDGGSEDEAPARAQSQSAAILDRLGVVWTPDLV